MCESCQWRCEMERVHNLAEIKEVKSIVRFIPDEAKVK